MRKQIHSPEVIKNRRDILKREARLRRFGYDSPTAIKFVVAQALPLNGSVLEIGTGKGRFLVALARKVNAVTTVDISAEEQQCARLNARYARVERKITFVLQDARKLPWANGTFDAVVTMNAMHHIPHFRQVLEEMLRVARPGGKVLMADFSPRGFQFIARTHRAEGKTHPRAHHDFRELRQKLRKRGLTTWLRKGCNQEVLLAQLPA